MISVLILTRNEEYDLPGCLASVAWSDDICVYDSGSTDATAQIAARAGARVFHRLPAQLPQAGHRQAATTEIFGGNESEHKNWGLAHIPFRYSWVLQLDADERVSPELAARVRHAVERPGNHVAFRLKRRDYWGERWLRHVIASPFNIRLFRPERMHYERMVNPVSVPDGPVGELGGYLDHFPFSKGMSHWLGKHNSYSSLEAEQLLHNQSLGQRCSIPQAFLAKDRNQRRFHQKELFSRLPLRPLIKFVALYFGKRGFLDGTPGLRYALLQAIYEYMIVLKRRELAFQQPPVPAYPILRDLHANSGFDD